MNEDAGDEESFMQRVRQDALDSRWLLCVFWPQETAKYEEIAFGFQNKTPLFFPSVECWVPLACSVRFCNGMTCATRFPRNGVLSTMSFIGPKR